MTYEQMLYMVNSTTRFQRFMTMKLLHLYALAFFQFSRLKINNKTRENRKKNDLYR